MAFLQGSEFVDSISLWAESLFAWFVGAMPHLLQMQDDSEQGGLAQERAEAARAKLIRHRVDTLA